MEPYNMECMGAIGEGDDGHLSETRDVVAATD